MPTDKPTTPTPEQQKNIGTIMAALLLERSAPDTTYKILLKQEKELAELQQKINPLLVQKAQVLREDGKVRVIISDKQNNLETKRKKAIEAFENTHKILQNDIEKQISQKQKAIEESAKAHKRLQDEETMKLYTDGKLSAEERDVQLWHNIDAEEQLKKERWENTATEPEKQYNVLTEQFKMEEEALKKEIAPLEKKATAELLEKTKTLQKQIDTEIANSKIYKTLLAAEPMIKTTRPGYKAQNAAAGLMIKHRLHLLVKKDVLQQIQKESIETLVQNVTAVKESKTTVRKLKDLESNPALKSAVEYSIAQLEQENSLLQEKLRKQCIKLGWKNNNGNLEYTTPTGSLIKMSDVLTLTHNAYVENAIKLDISSGKNNIQRAERSNLLQAVRKTNEATSTTPTQVEREKREQPPEVVPPPLEEPPPPPPETPDPVRRQELLSNPPTKVAPKKPKPMLPEFGLETHKVSPLPHKPEAPKQPNTPRGSVPKA